MGAFCEKAAIIYCRLFVFNKPLLLLTLLPVIPFLIGLPIKLNRIKVFGSKMNTEEKQQIRKRINSEIESASEQVAELQVLTQPIAPDAAIGRISRMEAINTKSVNELLLSKTKTKLQKLESSLSYIDHEEYGLCRVCKNPIPLGRLMMLPESDKCVDCA